MVELHCWITIRETYEISDDENIEKLLPFLNKELNELAYYNIKIKRMNGECYMEFSIFENHFASAKEALNLFTKVGEIAKGSYGLLYIHDDEDKYSYNSFQVWRLARGKITKFDDTILSPYVPTAEEFDEELN